MSWNFLLYVFIANFSNSLPSFKKKSIYRQEIILTTSKLQGDDTMLKNIYIVSVNIL